MTDIHYLGEYPTLSAVWKKFPNGGGYGDYVTILGVRHDWDESTSSWGDTPGDVNPALPEVVNSDIDVQGTVKARDGIKTADYIPGEAGAFIDGTGNAEFRSVDVDAMRVQDPLTGDLLPLPDFIKKYKTELPPDWSDYEQIIQFDNVRILAFDPLSQDKFYTTIGALKKLISDSIAAGSTGGGTFDIEILRSDDPEGIPTDNNVLSSLKTLMAIQAAINPMIGQYLSRIENDTALGLITFLQGIIAAGTSTFVNMIATGKITASNIDVNNTLKADILRVITQAYLQDVILKGQLNSETFTSGFLGSGFRLKNIDGRWNLEIDDLVVRKTMQIYVLIVQKIIHQGGQVLHSPAGAKLTAVTDGGSYWHCEHDGPVDFITDAQVLCQNFNVGSRVENPDGSTTFNGASVKRYWRRVTSYGAGWFNLSKTDCEAGSNDPEIKDDVAVLGHRNNPDWQNAILIASTGGNTPYIAHYAGINSFSLVGKEVVREGNLEGIVDSDFGQLTGYGLYSNNAYLKGVFMLLSGKTVEEVISDIDGELISVKSYVQTEIEAIPGKITMEVSKVQIGGRNLLRNYDQRFGMDFWSAGAISVDESGSPVVPTLLITGYVYIDPIVVNRDGTPLMPSSITLNISDGTQRTVPATWSSVDTSTTGPKTSYATYDVPAGVTGAPIAVNVIVNVTIGLLLIVSYVEPQPVTVYAGETPTLPATVIVNLNDGTTRIVTVTWSVDTSTWGEKSAIAVYNMPAGVSGTKPQISATVNVLELTISSVAQPQPVYVQVEDTPTLPTTVTLTLNNGTTRVVDVTWSSFSTDVVAVYELIGSYNLPQYVTGAKPAVTLDLTVQEDAIPVTITSVSQPEAITVPVGGVPVMPATITLNLSDLSTTQVAVTWGSYDTSTAGTYTIYGSYDLPEGVTGTMPAVGISLVVDAQMAGMWDGKSYIGSIPGAAVASLSGWDQISGRYSTGAILDGSLYMWGRNNQYQLGLDDTADRTTPTQVGIDNNWSMVAVSTWHALGIKNGYLYSWGLNNKGQLGLGDLITRQTPTKVGSFDDWTYIAANELFSFGIRSGMLYAWGHNEKGQLGLYDTTDRNSPTRVGSLTTWTKVAAGGHFGMGLAAGGLYTWGMNTYGQLGLGNTTTYRYPVKVGSFNDWTHIGAGMFHASAIRGGSLYSWGSAEWFQLGINTQTNVLSPTLVGTGFLDLAVREYHTITTKSDGMYVFGDGRYGEFGDDNIGYVTTPTKINSETPGIISVGLKKSYYTDSNGVLYGVGGNDNGSLGVGDTDGRGAFTMIGSLALSLNENNSDDDIFTDALKTGWTNQKAYLYLNNKSAAAVSLVVDRDGTPTTYLLASGINQYSIDLEGATGFGLSGTDYDVEVIEFAIGQYGIEPVWYEGI